MLVLSDRLPWWMGTLRRCRASYWTKLLSTFAPRISTCLLLSARSGTSKTLHLHQRRQRHPIPPYGCLQTYGDTYPDNQGISSDSDGSWTMLHTERHSLDCIAHLPHSSFSWAKFSPSLSLLCTLRLSTYLVISCCWKLFIIASTSSVLAGYSSLPRIYLQMAAGLCHTLKDTVLIAFPMFPLFPFLMGKV